MELEFFDIPITGTFTSRFLTLGCSFEPQVTPDFFLSLTPELDVSMGGDIKLEAQGESDEDKIEDENSPLLVGLGFGYSVSEKAALTASYRFALTPYLDGGNEDYKLNKLAVGVRFEL
jgi:opacity protein-like surface antigen